MKKKDTMKIRKEWLNEVINTLGELEGNAETNGESKLMYEMMKTLKENIDIEQGGNALFLCRRAVVRDSAFSSIPHPADICQDFFRKNFDEYLSQNVYIHTTTKL